MSVTAVGYRLSPQQKRAWQLLLANNGNGCLVEGVLLITSRIEPPIIEDWLDHIVQRHEILRTKFQALPGSSLPIQVVSDCNFQFDKIVDLTDLDAVEQEVEVEKLKQEARRPFFSFEEESLMRAILVTLSTEKKLLLISLSAMCSDRVGLINLALELGRNDSFRLGQDAARAEPAQYADIAGILNSFFEHEEMQDGREYWRSQVNAALFEARLPHFTHTLDRQGFLPKVVSRHLGDNQDCDCSELLHSPYHSASVYLLACYAALLYRLTGNSDLMIGAAYTVRSYEELADTVGPMEKYLPISCRIEPGATLTDLAQQLSDNCQEAEVWQESFTWDDVMGLPEREQELPYFPFQFEYWEAPEAISTYPVHISLIEIQGHLERFDLKLRCVRRADTFDIQAHYDPSVMMECAAARFVDEIITLIQSSTRQKKEAIDRLGILSLRERADLLTLAAGPKMPIPVGAYIHELIDRQGCQSIAVRFEDIELTYDSLTIRSNQLARHLQSLGVGEGVRVGIYLKRSPDVFISILSVLKSGGAYVPLDPEYPQARLKHILKDAGIRVTLTHSDLVSRLPDVGALPICLDSEWGEIARQSAEQVYPIISPESMAYVIYTSGSTGNPKGVCVSHRNLLSSTMARRVFYEGSPDCFLLLSPIAFDSSIAGVFWTLLEGGTLVLPPENAQRDPIQIAQLLGRGCISHTLAIPSLYHHILEAASPEQTSSLRAAIVAGEACPSHLPRLHMSKASNADLFNEYGPTEGAVWSTGCRYAANSSETKMPIGKPIANANAYVVDASGELAPMGVAGELFIGGEGIARGYLNQTGMTAERFVPNPFSRRAGERVYRTGDLVRWGEDDKLEFLGRIDHQVKIRGYRIELGEIEEALNSHHQVKQSVVITRENEGGDKRLLGYVAGEEGVTAGELKRHVRERLPEYMAPEMILILEEIPLTANGKVDRKRLLALEGTGSHFEEKDVVPRTPVEEILIGIFKEALRLDRVGRGDNFFELGGHSLLATQVVSRVRSAFGVEIGVGTIFEETTVEGLARRVGEMIRAGEKDEAPPLVRASREGRLPLSFAQQRLWFIDQLTTNNPLYNCTGAMRLEGGLDLEALERVINEIVRRHEVLRTRFEVVDGEPVQVVDAWEHRRLEVEDLRSLPQEEREEEVRRRASEDAVRRFDLSKGPLLTVKALKFEEEEHVLIYTMHHIVSDGWSMEVLSREVGELYRAYSAGEPSPLAELPIQYADFAVWQREYLAGGVMEAEVGYWREQLRDAAVLDLPTDHPRPPAPSYRGGGERIEISREVSEGLKKLSRQEGATLYMALMAAFKVVLMRYSGQEDISVGTVIANRTRREVEGLIGFFVNTLVMRTDLSGNPSFRELVRRERKVGLGAYGHQEAPFEMLVKEINPDRDLSRSPLFQVMMALHNTGREELELGVLKMSGVGEETGVVKFDLELNLAEGEEGIAGSLDYSLDLYEAETIRRMARRYELVVGEVVREAEQRVREIELVTAEEKRLIVEEWNRAEVECLRGMSARRLIEGQAERSPEAIAVVCEGKHFSYRELNRRANQLGSYLKWRGVGPDAMVGVCLERSVEMVVALMGVWKAGGVYLPMDPSYPEQRLRLMAEDAAPVVVVTAGVARERLEGVEVRRLDLDEEWEEVAKCGEWNPGGEVAGDDLAYVIYTSGSSGEPKGVMASQRNLASLLAASEREFGFEAGEEMLCLASFSFDISLFEVLNPLAMGGKVNILRREQILSLGRLLEELKSAKAAHAVPSLMKEIVVAIKEENGEGEGYGSVGKVFVGGELVAVDLLEEMRGVFKEARIEALYGPTEGTVICASESVGTRELRRKNIIGKPLGNGVIRICEEDGGLAPIGVRGEMRIGGAGVTRGYLNKPGVTAERFVPDVYSAEPGARAYRTGDLGRYEEDGRIEFLGRNDGQVKVRGYRIELEEIEAVLLQHPAIKEGVVVARGDKEKRLVAYLTPRHSERVALSELREYLKQRLPEYMAPSLYLWLEKIPVTSNGKIDRKALPEADDTALAREREYVAPRGAVEEALAAIWSELLGVEKVSVHDNFFELGGHSLLMISLIERMRQQGVYIDVRTFYVTPTVAALAASVTGASDAIQVPATTIPNLGKKVRI